MLEPKLYQPLDLPVPCSQLGDGGCSAVLLNALPPKAADISWVSRRIAGPSVLAPPVEELLSIDQVFYTYFDTRNKVGNFTCKRLVSMT